VIYGLALEALWPDRTVFSGRLSYCTTAGQFSEHEIPLLDHARRHGLEVLEIIDRAIELGRLAAMPAPDACRFCDFGVVCGRQEEQRTRRKAPDLMGDLQALRQLP
jgi:ATP-dependent helicase/nuclease subunit B